MVAFKVAIFFGLLAFSNAGLLPAQVYHTDDIHSHVDAPSYKSTYATAYAHDDEYDPHPQYKFGYDVQDSLSGDSKAQVEERDGDAVQGEYSLIDADGYKRIVKYTSDAAHGFNAVVNRVPLQHSSAAKTAVFKAETPRGFAAPATIFKDYPPHHSYHH